MLTCSVKVVKKSQHYICLTSASLQCHAELWHLPAQAWRQTLGLVFIGMVLWCRIEAGPRLNNTLGGTVAFSVHKINALRINFINV